MNPFIYNLLNIFDNIEYIHQNYSIYAKGFGLEYMKYCFLYFLVIYLI